MSAIVYSKTGQIDGEQAGIISLPVVDSALVFDPTLNATWTEFTSNVEATLTAACEDAGYIVVSLGGTVGRIPWFLPT